MPRFITPNPFALLMDPHEVVSAMNRSVALARLEGRTCRLLDRSPLRELVGLERLAELECNEAERAARRRQKAKAKFLAS